MRVALIVNRFSLPQPAPAVEAILRRRLGNRRVRTYACDSVEVAEQSAVSALAWGAERIGVVGGDGTVNGVVRSLMGGPVPLAALPAGTANDFATHFQYPADAGAFADVLLYGRSRPIDILKVDGVPFVTGGGIGLITAAVNMCNRCRTGSASLRKVGRLLRSTVYCVGVLAALPGLSRKPLMVELHHPGGKHRVHRLISLVVANVPKLGRRFQVAPGAQCDDGRFDLFAIHQHGGIRNLRSVAATVGIGREQSFDTARYRVHGLDVRLDRPAAFVGDGEILATGDRFVISTAQRSLLVLTLPDSSGRPDSASPLTRRYPRCG